MFALAASFTAEIQGSPGRGTSAKIPNVVADKQVLKDAGNAPKELKNQSGKTSKDKKKKNISRPANTNVSAGQNEKNRSDESDEGDVEDGHPLTQRESDGDDDKRGSDDSDEDEDEGEEQSEDEESESDEGEESEEEESEEEVSCQLVNLLTLLGSCTGRLSKEHGRA